MIPSGIPDKRKGVDIVRHSHPHGWSLHELHPIEGLRRGVRRIDLDHLHNADGDQPDGPMSMGSEITLNAVFVESVGAQQAEALAAALEEVGRLTHHSRDEIRTELVSRIERLGLRLCPVELGRFVDEVSRSEWVHVRLGAHAAP